MSNSAFYQDSATVRNAHYLLLETQIGLPNAVNLGGLNSGLLKIDTLDDVATISSVDVDSLLTQFVITASPEQMVAGRTYITTDPINPIELTLPDDGFAIGQQIQVIGRAAAGWVIKQNAGQIIYFLGDSTTLGADGEIVSETGYEVITLCCLNVAGTEWVVTNCMGNVDII